MVLGWVDFWFRLGFGLISSLFIRKDIIFWCVSVKNEKTSRDKMIATPNLKGVNRILVWSQILVVTLENN